jgi:4-hydroxybenzoyl-CoA reductase subunit beta
VDLGSYSSRVTFMMGNAARKAAEDLRDQLLRAASRTTGYPVERLRVGHERIEVMHRPEIGVSYLEALHQAMERSGALIASGAYTSPPMGGTFKGARAGTAPAYSFAAYVAQVRVDTETGEYRPTTMWAAFDCGRVLNRLAVEGQIEGSIHMGLGQFMGEAMQYRGARLMNPSLMDYKIPMPQQMPRIELFLVGEDDPERPVRGEGGWGGPADRDPARHRATPCTTPWGPGSPICRSRRTGSSEGDRRSVARKHRTVEGAVGRMHLDPFELHRPSTVEETVVLALARYARGPVRLPGRGAPTSCRTTRCISTFVRTWSRSRMWRSCGATLSPGSGRWRAFPTSRPTPSSEPTSPPSPPRSARVATPLVRASGTVGGNLLVETRCFFFNQSYFWRTSLGYCLKADGDRCHVVPQKEKCYATFSGDLAPALMVLDAEVEVAGPGGRRRFPLTDLYDLLGDGIRRTHLAPGELLVAVHLPTASRGRPGTYLKLRVRPSYDFPELGVAASGEFDGRHVRSLRVAVGGADPYPRRFDALTDALVGQELSDERLASFATEVERAVRPVHNTFLLPDYRRRMVSVYVRRALTQLREGKAA